MNKQTLVQPPYMVIHAKDFEKVTSEKLDFNPSAIAVHPTTHDIYILTTKNNKGLAIFSHDGVLKSYQPIDKDLMPQPEGICFSPGGKLYISSEGKNGEPGNLFEFDK
jgi:secreted PhoX family phosphatase